MTSTNSLSWDIHDKTTELIDIIKTRFITSNGLLARNYPIKERTLFDNFDDTFVIQADHSIQYRLCTQWSIWNKDFMLKYLKPGMTAWDFELQGFNDYMNDGYRILGLKGDSAVVHGDAMRSSKSGDIDNFNFNAIFWDENGKSEKEILESSTISDMKKEGII